MVDLTRKIAAEKENEEKALDNLKDAMGSKEKSTIELAAIATFPHNIYNGIENIFKQNTFIENYYDIQIMPRCAINFNRQSWGC